MAETLIGKYEIRRELGRGGMGVVYEGYDRDLTRSVAIKTLAAHLAQEEEFVKRFVREARAIAQLSHPNIVTIHEIGAQGGAPFIVMEYVKGHALSQYIARTGRIETRRALEIARQVALALAEAHRCNIIHRDIKPANIMLTESGRVKVMDFGLAKICGAGASLTAAGTALGTPLYMSPEQWKGVQVDARTDIYSLGVVLFEMLAGAPPFRQGDTPYSLMHQIVDEPFPDLDALDPPAPPAVTRMIQRMVAKDPALRYPVVQQLYDDLTACLRESRAETKGHRASEPGATAWVTLPGDPAGLETVSLAGKPPAGPGASPGGIKKRSWRRTVLYAVLIVLGMLVLMFSCRHLAQQRRNRLSQNPPPSPTAPEKPPESPKTPGPLTRESLVGTAWQMPGGLAIRLRRGGVLSTWVPGTGKGVKVFEGTWSVQGATLTLTAKDVTRTAEIAGDQLLVEGKPAQRLEESNLPPQLRGKPPLRWPRKQQ